MSAPGRNTVDRARLVDRSSGVEIEVRLLAAEDDHPSMLRVSVPDGVSVRLVGMWTPVSGSPMELEVLSKAPNA